MAYRRAIVSAVIFVVACCGQSRAAVIPPEWADHRINPCAKVVTHFIFCFSLSTFNPLSLNFKTGPLSYLATYFDSEFVYQHIRAGFVAVFILESRRKMLPNI